ncbi:hypothetical protein AB9P05_04000 [Roseivirga sp. BDSF3-8]|uniref:hypothetical protein n=1 Tax=Roseivirga sp. BDSF3-8 TaxID=3241598 RepID=UPI003531AB84
MKKIDKAITFEQVNHELGLELTPDWGIIHAGGNRTEEFIEYISDRDFLDKRIKYEFMELIIASTMNSQLDFLLKR